MIFSPILGTFLRKIGEGSKTNKAPGARNIEQERRYSQGLKMRPVFLKISEIRQDRLAPISEKQALFTKKSVQKSDSATSNFFHSVEFLNTGTACVFD
jgi:hypothetical protein